MPARKHREFAFGYRSTASEVAEQVDLTGRYVVVTGGYSGIGTETVRALAGAGAKVIVGARREAQAREVLDSFEGDIAILPLDLADPKSIDSFADSVAERTASVDILVNNAAIMASPLARDARGYEMQFATNHLGHFQLAARLWPLLVADGGARVVALSRSGTGCRGWISTIRISSGATMTNGSPTDRPSRPCIVRAVLDKLGEAHGVRAFAVHPGGIATPLQRHLTMDEQRAMGWYDEDGNVHEAFKSTEEGAATSVWCATSPLLEGMGGIYCEDCDIAVAADPDNPRSGGYWPHIRDEALAERLWADSERMVGVEFRP